jgi:hypothetical protein
MMPIHLPSRYMAMGLILGALACAGNKANTDEAAAAKDTTSVQNPPGYAGMERDTSQVPPGATQQPVDTFLEKQGAGTPQDTMGYSGAERVDTSRAADTSSVRRDTSATGRETTGVNPSGAAVDTSSMTDSTAVHEQGPTTDSSSH